MLGCVRGHAIRDQVLGLEQVVCNGAGVIAVCKYDLQAGRCLAGEVVMGYVALT
jgi:hypothetical protein